MLQLQHLLLLVTAASARRIELPISWPSDTNRQEAPVVWGQGAAWQDTPVTLAPPAPTTQNTPVTSDPAPIGEVSPTTMPAELLTLRPALERGLLDLCLRLEKSTNSLRVRENSVLAPLSVAAIGALLMAGAGGITKKELQTLFGIQNIPHKEEELHRVLAALFSELETTHDNSHKISYGSGLFIQKGEAISSQYLKLATEVYRSEVLPVDFRAANYDSSLLINQWVANRTEGKIRTLLEDVVEPSTVMIIANVFFFRGAWEQPFVEKYTKLQKFYVSEHEIISVPLMVSLFRAHYSKVRGSHTVLGLPYKGGQVSMYFLLPEYDLEDFVSTLTPDKLLSILNQTVVQSTIVAIPRMRVEGSLELSGPLASMGARTLFNPRLANLSGIGRGVYVSEMHHKVSIEVTESGTVGAAATAVTILRDGSTPLFRADRPFLFFIFHQKSGTILFWGTVFRPQPIHNS